MASTFTESEQKIMAMAWQCFVEQPKVDFGKLAGLVGMTNEGSARNAWTLIRRKLAQLGEKTGNREGNPDVTPKKRGKRQVTQSDIGEEEEESPTKKARTRPGNAKVSQGGAKIRAGSMDSGVEVKIEDDFHAGA